LCTLHASYFLPLHTRDINFSSTTAPKLPGPRARAARSKTRKAFFMCVAHGVEEGTLEGKGRCWKCVRTARPKLAQSASAVKKKVKKKPRARPGQSGRSWLVAQIPPV
jgi:hypothetical protein